LSINSYFCLNINDCCSSSSDISCCCCANLNSIRLDLIILYYVIYNKNIVMNIRDDIDNNYVVCVIMTEEGRIDIVLFHD